MLYFSACPYLDQGRQAVRHSLLHALRGSPQGLDQSLRDGQHLRVALLQMLAFVFLIEKNYFKL